MRTVSKGIVTRISVRLAPAATNLFRPPCRRRRRHRHHSPPLHHLTLSPLGLSDVSSCIGLALGREQFVQN